MRPSPPRAFGRFVLRQLLGKSERTMAWLVFDPRNEQELMLCLPRVQPADASALEAWTASAREAARLDHPALAHVVEVGVAEHWPYVCVDRAAGVTLGEWLGTHPAPLPADAAAMFVPLLEGLAFAHEAAVVHGDLQLHTVLVDPEGRIRLAALAVACDLRGQRSPASGERTLAVDPALLRARRDGAQRDLLACGLLLHQLLAGEPGHGEPDTGRLIERLPPLGREPLRLPWSTPQPVAEPLRAIAARAVAATETQRYLGARSLLRALRGWLATNADTQGGALALLLDRLHSVGHLPARPGASLQIARLAGSADAQRTDELAAQILDDMALSFELLRSVNSAQVQMTQASGNGAVLTLRRAVALMGIDGVRRAALSLRAWPGPMSADGAAALERVMDQVRLAGRTAQALRPAGYDAEVVYLVTLLQNLGRLLVQYHFPDEAQQIRNLMQPVPPPADAEPDTPEQPGLSEEAAAHAVLGVDTETIGAAVARHWGLGDEVQHLIRRLPSAKPVRQADSDADVLRMTASAANEAVDAVGRSTPLRAAAALDLVAQRYARALKIEPRSLREALQAARRSARGGVAVPTPLDDAPAATVAGPLG